MENENVLKLVELAFKNKSKRTILKRVSGLSSYYEEYKKFVRKSKLTHEDQVTDSFCEKVKNGEILITETQSTKEVIPRAKFSKFLDNYCLNFVETEERDKHLTFDDLWEGIMAYGRFRWKNYLSAGQEYAKLKKIKKGHLLRISEMYSPSEVLEIKGWPENGRKWTPKIESELAKHRSFFENFILGFFRGYQSHFLEITKKTSEDTVYAKFRKITASNPRLFELSIDFYKKQPRFHGISLPYYAKFQIAFEKKNEKDKLKFFKAVLREKLLTK